MMIRLDPRHWTFAVGFALVLSVFAVAGLWAYDATGPDAQQTDPEGFSATGTQTGNMDGSIDHGAHDGQAVHDHDGDEDWTKEDGIGPWGLVKGEPPEFVHEHPWPAGEGEVPSRSEAMDFEDRYNSLFARGSDALDRLAAKGYFSGSGTLADPYVLERFYVDGDLVLQSIDRALVIREGYVTGQMKLNYIGSDVLVHHVYAEDLRVNENVERSGLNTGGLFHDNTFAFIGQLRHFSGEFRDNVVGPKPQGVATSYLSDSGVAQIPPGLVFNFDGFQGANVHENTIHGRVDIKLHGHYHADCLTCTAHDHSNESHFPAGNHESDNGTDGGDGDGHHDDAQTRHEHEGEPSHHDEASDEKREWLKEQGFRSHHSIRYHSLYFHDNEIHVDPQEQVALRYYDRAHRADDETAASEPNPYLEDPHVHYQYVLIEANELHGGGLVLDVFNAQDDRHAVSNLGVFHAEGNTITTRYETDDESPRVVYGMNLKQADEIEMLVRGNDVHFERADSSGPAGLVSGALYREPDRYGLIADRFDHGNVTFKGNTVHEGEVGLYARKFSDQVWWTVQDNDFRTEYAMWDEQNGNPPKRGGGA